MIQVDKTVVLRNDQPLPDLRQLGESGAGNSRSFSRQGLGAGEPRRGLTRACKAPFNPDALIRKGPGEPQGRQRPLSGPLPWLGPGGIKDVGAYLAIPEL